MLEGPLEEFLARNIPQPNAAPSSCFIPFSRLTPCDLLHDRPRIDWREKESEKKKEGKGPAITRMDSDSSVDPSVDPPPSDEQQPAGESAKALLKKIKDAGVAGAVSYAGWELLFWLASVPVCLAAYYGLTGHLPDLANQEDVARRTCRQGKTAPRRPKSLA